MEKQCIYCGQITKNGICVNDRCPGKESPARLSEQAPITKRPMSLQERRRQMYEMENRKNRESQKEEVTSESVVTREKIEVLPRETNGHIRTERKVSAETSKPAELTPSEEFLQLASGGFVSLLFFIADYYKEPGKVVAAAARKRDEGMGRLLFFTSVILSAIGTLLFGTIHLEDFFVRWVVCGLMAPFLAYGGSLLFGSLFAALSPTVQERRKREETRLSFGELFSTVAVSSVFPNLLLLLTCVLSPMDRSMEIFQFFALLITLSWIVCLLFSLFTVYGGDFSLWGLLLTVAFVFFAFLGMRSLWVWYLTGDFRFSFYIPLSVFFS